MRLIIGGYAQGKEEYAKELFPDYEIVEKPACGRNGVIFIRFHKWFYKELEKKTEISLIKEQINQMLASCQDVVIVCDEVGNGIVPMKEEERFYREQLGRLLTELAKKADTVERILCKIPMKLK